jgi:hypothetical protein
MHETLSFVDRPLPPIFQVRTVELGPGQDRLIDEAEWRGALVVLEQGEIELESLAGTRRRFERGAILCFAGAGLRAVHNDGSEPALLVAVSRGGTA